MVSNPLPGRPPGKAERRRSVTRQWPRVPPKRSDQRAALPYPGPTAKAGPAGMVSRGELGVSLLPGAAKHTVILRDDQKHVGIAGSRQEPHFARAPQSLMPPPEVEFCPTAIQTGAVAGVMCAAIPRSGTSNLVEPSMREVGGGGHATGSRSSCRSVARASIPRLKLPTLSALQ